MEQESHFHCCRKIFVVLVRRFLVGGRTAGGEGIEEAIGRQRFSPWKPLFAGTGTLFDQLVVSAPIYPFIHPPPYGLFSSLSALLSGRGGLSLPSPTSVRARTVTCMAGTNNHGALMEDWMLPTPSPRTLMSSFLNEEFSSGPLSDIFGDNGSNKPQDGIEKSKAFVDSSREETAQVTKAPLQFESNPFGANQKSGSRGGLAERMAARAGFAVLKIDTSHVISSAPIRSPVTIPPGVSPRELLESPVFLPNAIAATRPCTRRWSSAKGKCGRGRCGSITAGPSKLVGLGGSIAADSPFRVCWLAH